MFYVGLAGWNFGMSFCFSSLFVFGTPLLQSFALSYTENALFFLSGPLSGLLVQPLVGWWSDRITFRFGRRRILYVALGGPLTIAGMGLFGAAEKLGALLGDKGDEHASAAWIALASLWSAFLGLNVVGITGFALQLDLCTNPLESARGTAAITIAGALGNIAATALGFVDLTGFVPALESNTSAQVYIALIVYVVASVPTLILGREKAYVPPAVKQTTSLADRWAAVKRVPTFFWLLCTWYCLASAAATPMLFNFTDFVGKAVFKGVDTAAAHTPLKEQYDAGVRWGSLCLAIQSVCMVVMSASLPTVQKKLSIASIMAIGALFGTISAGTAVFDVLLTKTYVATVMSIPFGIFNSIFSTLPFQLMSLMGTDSGFFVGLLNSFQVVAQLLVNQVTAAVIEASANNTANGMAFGGIFALIAIPMCLLLTNPPRKPTSEEDA